MEIPPRPTLPRVPPARVQDDKAEVERRYHEAIEVQLSVGVLGFGFLVMALEVLLLSRRSWIDYNFALKLLGFTLIVTAGLFLIVAGYSQEQCAPMMALLGTALGYLLAKESKGRKAE